MFISKCSEDTYCVSGVQAKWLPHCYKRPGSRAGPETLRCCWSCAISAMPGLLLPAAREQCMRFCFCHLLPRSLNYPRGCQEACFSGMFPVLFSFASFRRVEWPGSSLSFLNRYLAMGPHAWHLGIKFLFRPCVAVWGLDWTCLLVFGIWSSVLRRLPSLDLLSLSLLMPLQFPSL